MSKLTRQTLSEDFNEQNDNLNLTDAKAMVDFMFDHLSNLLLTGLQLRIKGVGTLKKVSKSPRIGRNPKTGEPATIKGRDIIVLSPKSDITKRVTFGQWTLLLEGAIPTALQRKLGPNASSVLEQCVRNLARQITSVKSNNTMEIRGFGTFFPLTQPARMARNPKTGASVSMDETTRIRFRTSKSLITLID